MRRRARATATVVLAAALALAAPARAEEPGDRFGQPRPPGDEEGGGRVQRVHAEERPFVFLLDPSTPSRRDVSVSYGLGVGSGVAAERPLPAIGAAGAITHSLTLAYGATERFSPFVEGRIVQPTTAGGDATAGLSAGARWQLTAPGRPLRAAVMGAFLREPGGALGGAVRAAVTYDVGRLRVGANAHFEKIFAAGRDGVDMIALAGASYRVLDWLRLGAEYVAQDLEDAFEQDEAEGGARHYAGPSFAIDLDRGRVQIVGGPAFGLNSRAARVVGRAAVVMTF
ncbi:MAG TPA: hypothetical protein VGQ83_27075 [Polyangia bacterium]